MQEMPFKEVFWPLYRMDEAEPITFTNVALRASFALLAAGISWLLYANAPDKGDTFVYHDALSFITGLVHFAHASQLSFASSLPDMTFSAYSKALF